MDPTLTSLTNVKKSYIMLQYFTQERSVTVTTNEYGQQNMFAREPQMYVSKTDAERYGYETYAERAEKMNGRFAMMGFVAAVVSYATSGSVFFFGAFGF
jgi:hypothetical protein|tara:strand:- start:26 stop:322 length:297 start_codon:yes stop_codon:yes gene_type:complete